MSAIERRLTEALAAGSTPVEPAPDLFTRVQSSIGDNRRRRRRLLQWGLIGATALIAVLVVVVSRLGSGGELGMNWWVLELLTTLLLIGTVAAPVHQAVRHGLAADVFHDNPLTGKSYIILTRRLGGRHLVDHRRPTRLAILVMPVLGRLFSLNRRLQPPRSNPHLRSARDVDG